MQRAYVEDRPGRGFQVQRTPRMGGHAVEVPGGEGNLLTLSRGRDVGDLVDPRVLDRGMPDLLDDIAYVPAADPARLSGEEPGCAVVRAIHDHCLDGSAPDIDSGGDGH